jgi:neutral ceramidase
VLVDNLGLAAEAIEDAKAIASKQCGIATDKMLVSATHTHSAPASNVKEGPEPAVAYRKVLVTGIAESIVKAHAALRPAAVGYAAHPLPDEVFNRRWFLKPGKMPPNPFGRLDQVKMNPGTSPDVLDRPAGPTDPDITVLSIQDAKKKPLAIYANYSLHYVGGTPKAQVSADYFGEFARVMPSRLRGDDEFVAIMTNGTSGDINNIPFGSVRPPRQEFEQIRLVAAKAADTAWFAHQKIGPHRNDARIGMRQRLITLKMRKPTAEQLATARTIAAITDKEELAKHPPLADSYARRAIALAEGPDSVTVPLQAIRIGDFAICAIPFETFCEIGLELKARSPFGRSMIVSIANGYNGYLPTPEQHKLGGYETWLGTNKVQEDTSVILVENLVEMLAELKKAN